MIDQLVFEGPLNNLSMGNVSINILKSLYAKGVKVLYLPIGQVDIGNYNLTDDFKLWLQSSTNNFLTSYQRNWVSLKNWHIVQSWHFPTDNKYLLTYHECDQSTPQENNIIKNINKVFFCGSYSESVFREYGNDNVDSFNLGFDKDSFRKIDKVYFKDRIQWHLGGKMELTRKKTLKILSLWAKKYGKKQGEFFREGEPKHFLNCAIFNPFLGNNPDEVKANNERFIGQALEGQKYININFFGFLDRESYNDLLNASDIDLTGLSGAESWNLPAFNFTCLSKWSIVLNCTGHKSWANKDNCILINPNGKCDSTDNIHFQKGSPFSQGNFFTFSDEEVLKAMDIAASKAKIPNVEGGKLAEKFTYDKSVDYLLTKIEEDLNKK